LKRYKNARNLCAWSHKVSCGNRFLREYALRHNPRSFYNPTVIDTSVYRAPAVRENGKRPFVVGWTGSHSTLRYLDEILPVLARLENDLDFRFHVISDARPRTSLRSLVFMPWSKATEVEDLLTFDVGVMPLADTPWARGKCGFKALQYLALGIPALVSPVGVNTEIVTHGVNGFHCAAPGEWAECIRKLAGDAALRERLRAACRQVVVERFSVDSNRANFLTLFS
jgi:glycosyltransferase involved in cell wall biosynthesis